MYPHGYVVWADMRVVDGPTVHVRVQGTTGWLFTHRDGDETLLPVDPATAAAAASADAAATAPSTPPKHDLSVAAVGASESRHERLPRHPPCVKPWFLDLNTTLL
jgi:hypothetical protein